ncbi:MAG: hypothetical protein FH749_08275 [Firmicutes bacterium]|nr:hypothetical protein [Bacillota bacterium]
MSKRFLALAGLIFLTIFVFTGCKDIQDSFKPGSFGQTEEEQAMVEALTDKYGDLTEFGDPRFLETMVTSHVENFIPVDVVSKYNKDTEKLYVWFVYDNFNEDVLDIEWVYLDTDFSIHTFQSETGKDFGRGTFILEQPDDGWPTGKYKVSIRGRGIEDTVYFEIIDGPTVADALPFENGKITLPSSPGWYLTGWDYFISPVDASVVGGSYGGPELFDYHESQGGKNDFSYSIKRSDKNGKTLHAGTFHVTWTDPASYLAPGARATLTVNRTVEGWGISRLAASFDNGDLEPSRATSSVIRLVSPQGETAIADSFQGTMSSEKVIPEGKPGDKKAVRIILGNDYGFRYNYEWRE